MNLLHSKRLLLIVTGGVAAYKSPEIVRRLRSEGAEVRVAMTAAAQEFVTELTFQAVSGRDVYTSLFLGETNSGMGHIELARWADAIIVAPASADFISQIVAGQAGDLASTICLAANSKILIAPAMNQQMWKSSATQDNIGKLKERGFILNGPLSGDQACGEIGPGRMAEPTSFVGAVAEIFKTGHLSGLRILITAGPTHEPIDPVRYITNRSSGLMGYSIASAATEMNGIVSLVSGPTSIEPPSGVKVIRVSTAQEMFDATLEEIGSGQDIFIGAAAVADYTPVKPLDRKIKRREERFLLEMLPNPDILLAVSQLKSRPFTVGFAAETDNLERNALSKLNKKSLDMVAANLVGISGQGFNSEQNELLVFQGGTKHHIPKAPKLKVAKALLGLIAKHYKKTRIDRI